MKTKHYILTAIASYIIFVVATIPAKPVISLMTANTPINMQGISGTLWNGKTSIINIQRTTRFTDSEWSFKPWKLLIGQIAADVSGKYSSHTITTELGTTFFGKYFVNDLTANIEASDIAKIASIPLAELDGLFTANIEHAEWKQGELPEASGIINWKNAAITVAETVSLGNVSISLNESEQQLLQADIKNKGGDINISGTAGLLPEANYTVNIKLSPASSANSNIENSLAMFAKKQRNGDYLFQKTGPLNQLGIM